MAADDIDQDQLAAEWAAALEDDNKGGSADPFEAALAAASGGGAGGGGGGDDALAEQWAAALAGEEETQVKKEREQASLAAKSREASFKDLTQEARAPRPDSGRRDLDFILDIPLDVSAELGRTKLLINELLQLGQGSVIELNKLAGEPLEVYVNGKLVARGEAVVINEKFGVRLTDIISPLERVKQLPVLVLRVPVRHPRDVVRHRAMQADLLRPLPEPRRQLLRIGRVRLEERLHEPLRLLRHDHDPVMPVDVFVQEVGELQLRPRRRRRPGARPGSPRRRDRR